MESPIEKPFKCSTCPQSFTNEDHLQVHRKRHDMSLNLDLLGSSGTHPEGFADETPTPTRFFRISEEVGFFQDIQNVNPFDEQFSKAATSGNEQENFQFSLSTLCSSSNNDSLNTPQVLGFPTPTQLPLVTHQNQNETAKKKSKLTGEGQLQQQSPIAESRTNPDDKEPEKCLPVPATPASHTPNSPPIDKRTELLERNRAAAVRSRERRKQWVSELETKNMELMALLAKVHGELKQARTENLSLRQELKRHSNCNVSQAEAEKAKTPPSPIFHPAILRNTTSIAGLGVTILPKLKEISPLELPSVSLPQPGKPKSKRGRPRKGQEKRASLILPPSLPPGPPRKVQIMPLTSSHTSQSTSVIVLHKS